MVSSKAVVMELNAAIVTVRQDTPLVLTVRQRLDDGSIAHTLPSGPYDPDEDRTLEIGLRRWVEDQARIDLGYVEQLYTFGDRNRHGPATDDVRRVSVGYLALTDKDKDVSLGDTEWRSWYDYLPWEDHRSSFPAMVEDVIRPALQAWAEDADDPRIRSQRLSRARLCFGDKTVGWDDEWILDRYELLYEAELVTEALRDKGKPGPARDVELGRPMQFDHRRILATAMGRLRGKLKYRPVVFELMPDSFTLLELQRTVEALAGLKLHKQNFRRMVASSGLIEDTGTLSTRTGGRPAKLFRFRREVLRERVAPGVRLPSPKSAR